MFDSNNTNNNSTFLSSDVCQSTTPRYTPFNAQSIQNAISQLPFFFNTVTTEDPRLNAYPMYPCPHKDLFHIARQIDKIHDLKCQYRHDSHTFIIVDTERNRTLGVLGKDNIANQIVLQCDGYSDRCIRLITLELDCDLLALIQIGSPIVRGLYKVNSVE